MPSATAFGPAFTSLGAIDDSTILLVLAAIAFSFAVGRILGRRRRPADEPPAGKTPTDAAQRLQETADRIMSEIEAAGRETIARAETRLRVLNELVVRAERAGSRLPACGDRPPDGFDEVYRLSDEGADADAISRHTSFQRSEVELILSLRHRSGRASRQDAGGSEQ